MALFRPRAAGAPQRTPDAPGAIQPTPGGKGGPRPGPPEPLPKTRDESPSTDPEPDPEPEPGPKPRRTKSRPSPFRTGPIAIGTNDGFTHDPVEIDPQVLTRHTAIFGANGSGKTVLALTIVEGLLEQGVSVVLFDRKGDLATYAVDAAWEQETGAPDERRRRAELRGRVDVHLYTPGCPGGRPLVLPLLPSGLGKLDADARQEQARQAATILCEVCSPSPAKSDMFVTVLAMAVDLLCKSDARRSLDDLQDLLLTAPQELLDLLPAHNSKHCEDVGRRLNERRVAYGRLFSDKGERLDLGHMLAGAEPGA